MTTLAIQVAERIHALRYEDIAPEAREWTASAFVDTVACTLAGVQEDGPQILMRVPGVAIAPGPALIHGTNRRTSVLDAALVNGTASHVLGYDDVAGSMDGHPSVMPILASSRSAKCWAAPAKTSSQAMSSGLKTSAGSAGRCITIIMRRAGIRRRHWGFSAPSPGPRGC